MSARGIPALEVTGRAQPVPRSLRRRADVLYPLAVALMVAPVLAVAIGVAARWVAVPGAIGSLLGLAILLLVIAYYSLSRSGSGQRPAARVLAPVVGGRWLAIATPAHGVPSHGTHVFGQSYAIDMLAEPADGSRPGWGGATWMRPAGDFPAFGASLMAGADAVVSHVDDGQRDHRSRNSWLTLPYLLVEGALRGFGGYRRVFGNHVVLDLGDGTWLAYAHLQRASITVAVGDRVVAGQQIARCGNSGNSSEPHLHVQLMDRPRPPLAAGLPFAFAATDLEGDGGMRAKGAVVPGRLQTFTTTHASWPNTAAAPNATNPQPDAGPLAFTRS